MKCHVTRAPFASGPLVDSNQNFVIVAGSTKAPKTWAIGPRISCEAVAVSSVSFIAGSHVRALTQRIDLYRCTSHANTTNRCLRQHSVVQAFPRATEHRKACDVQCGASDAKEAIPESAKGRRSVAWVDDRRSGIRDEVQLRLVSSTEAMS